MYNVFVPNQFKFKIICIDALLSEQFPADCNFKATTWIYFKFIVWMYYYQYNYIMSVFILMFQITLRV